VDKSEILIKSFFVQDRLCVSWAWNGPKSGIVFVGHLDRDAFLDGCPHRLKMVATDLPRDGAYYARCDGGYVLSWLWHTLAHRLGQHHARFRRHVVVGLMRVGLAYVEEGCYIRWSDIGRRKP
jgi:hypothetical protein